MAYQDADDGSALPRTALLRFPAAQLLPRQPGFPPHQHGDLCRRPDELFARRRAQFQMGGARRRDVGRQPLFAHLFRGGHEVGVPHGEPLCELYPQTVRLQRRGRLPARRAPFARRHALHGRHAGACGGRGDQRQPHPQAGRRIHLLLAAHRVPAHPADGHRSLVPHRIRQQRPGIRKSRDGRQRQAVCLHRYLCFRRQLHPGDVAYQFHG